MTIQGTPYQPELDTRLDTLEDAAATFSTADSSVGLRVDSVAKGLFDVTLSGARETVAATGTTLSASALVTVLNITGGGTMVLPAPSAQGQVKFLDVTAANSSITIALTNVLSTFTNLVITASGAGVALIAPKSTKWAIVSPQVNGSGIAFA